MFADVRGYTRLMRERGPQVLTPFVEEFVRRARGAVVDQDGILDRYLGDAVLALFNVPVRHPDHVSRAVRAAKRIQALVPAINARFGDEPLLQVGIGITTGAAMATAIGSTRCEDYTALGDAINIASRLQSEAAPGEILVSEDAFKAVAGEYPGAPERVLTLKGITEQVKAYSVSGAGSVTPAS